MPFLATAVALALPSSDQPIAFLVTRSWFEFTELKLKRIINYAPDLVTPSDINRLHL